MSELLKLFFLFLKINLLSTSGPASVGLLYKETVGVFMSESDFVEAVGFSSALPGSDAIQLAMFVGYAAGGVPGALAALVGTILPPTVIMLAVVSLLQRLRGEAWINNFVQGLAPAVAVLMVLVAWQLFSGEASANLLRSLVIAFISFAALTLNISPVLVLLLAGILGILLYP